MTRHALALAALCALAALPAPAVAQEKVLTLDQAIQAALRNNPQIVSARETVSATTSKVAEAKAGYLPSASAILAYKRMTMNSAAIPTLGSTSVPANMSPQTLALLEQISAMSTAEKQTFDSANSFSASLSVNQTIYDFGRTGGAYEASKAVVTAADADLKTARDAVYLSVVQSFFGVLAMQETVAVAAETRKQMEKHLELAQAQVANGVRTKIDVTRAQSDLASANLSVIKAANALAVARVNLNNAMGTPEAGDYRVERPPAAGAPAYASAEEATREAIARRPEFRSLQEKIRSLEASLVAVRSGYYPVIAANGGLTYSGYDLGGMVYNWQIGASATWNFFSGFYTQNTVQEVEATVRSLQAAVHSLELGIRLEIESAMLAYREARESMTPAQALVNAARETLELGEARYAAGAGSIVEVTDAQSIYTQARAGLIQAELNLETARARLLKAVGQIAVAKEGE